MIIFQPIIMMKHENGTDKWNATVDNTLVSVVYNFLMRK